MSYDDDMKADQARRALVGQTHIKVLVTQHIRLTDGRTIDVNMGQTLILQGADDEVVAQILACGGLELVRGE